MQVKSFEETVMGYYKFLNSKAFHLTYNRDDASDLVHDTILKAFENKEKYVNDVALGGWLFNMMKNHYFNQIKKKEVKGRYNIHHKNYYASIEYNIGERVVSQEEVDVILNKNLNKNLRETFDLYQNNYEYHEIADKVSIPIGTVKSRINTSRRILKEVYEKK